MELPWLGTGSRQRRSAAQTDASAWCSGDKRGTSLSSICLTRGLEVRVHRGSERISHHLTKICSVPQQLLQRIVSQQSFKRPYAIQ